MHRTRRILLRTATAIAWAAAIAGIWLLPVRVVIVATGAAVAGTVVVKDKDADKRFLIHAVADIAHMARSKG